MKKFKRIMALVLVGTFLLTSFGCASSGTGNDKDGNSETAKNALEEIKTRGELIVGLDDTFAPMGYRDEKTNELIGFDIDMGNELGKRLGVKVKWQPSEWDGIVGSLKTKKFDMIISGMSMTEERKAQIDFSQPYVIAGIGMVVKEGNDSIKSVEDLKGKKIATQTGSSGYEACRKLGYEDAKLYDQYPEAFQDLEIGRIDVIVVDVTTAAHYISKKPGVYQLAGDRIEEDTYGIGMRKEDKELQAEINKIITEMEKDGTLTSISKKWFGDDVTPKAE